MDVNKTSCKVTFTGPNDATITEYKVEYVNGNRGLQWSEIGSLTMEKKKKKYEIKLDNLTPDRTYLVR